jgi:hypothetical protein
VWLIHLATDRRSLVHIYAGAGMTALSPGR